MAEKEERIYVYRFTEDNGICPLEEFCTKFPGQCGHCKEILTRTETVEKMAKALVEYEKTNNPNACEWTDLKERAKDIYRERAEAALNAILEGK